MAKQRIERPSVDLRVAPSPIPFDPTHTHVCVGDLHGNALKLIYILIVEGFLQITQDDYNTLRDIYYRDYANMSQVQRHGQIKADIDTFKRIIDHATIDTRRSLRLIGDELADRGRNDFYTLLVIKKLHESGLDCDILLSNHSVEFLKYVRGLPYEMPPEFIRSFILMKDLVQKGLISQQELTDLIEKHYKPMVKAISYTLSPSQDITIYTHAPIGLETTRALAQTFQLPYSEASPALFLDSIDFINRQIPKLMRDIGALNGIIKAEQSQSPDPEHLPVPVKLAPLWRLLFNRHCGSELQTAFYGSPKGPDFVHGHTEDLQLPHHLSLDDLLGKDDPPTPRSYFTHQCSQLTEKQRTHQLVQALRDPTAIMGLLIDGSFTLYDLFNRPVQQFSVKARDEILTRCDQYLDATKNTLVKFFPDEQVIFFLLKLTPDKFSPAQFNQIVALLGKVDKSFWLTNNHALMALLSLPPNQLSSHQRTQILSFFINQLHQPLNPGEGFALIAQLSQLCHHPLPTPLDAQQKRMIQEEISPRTAPSVGFFTSNPSTPANVPSPQDASKKPDPSKP